MNVLKCFINWITPVQKYLIKAKKIHMYCRSSNTVQTIYIYMYININTNRLRISQIICNSFLNNINIKFNLCFPQFQHWEVLIFNTSRRSSNSQTVYDKTSLTGFNNVNIKQNLLQRTIKNRDYKRIRWFLRFEFDNFG